ncbi:MAG: hypothetical protein ACOX3W_04140 [Christensenellaceae bacterium]
MKKYMRKKSEKVIACAILFLLFLFVGAACQKKQQNTAISDADTWEKPSISTSHIPAATNTGNPFYDFMPEGLLSIE